MRVPLRFILPAIAAIAVTALAAPDPARAEARVIKSGSAVTSSLDGRIRTRGDVPGRQQAGVSIVDVWSRVPAQAPEVEIDEEEEEADALPQRIVIVPVVRERIVRACPHQPTRRLRAGDVVRSGGNLARVPADEATLDIGTCTPDRPDQRFTGFRKVYKGRTYLSEPPARGRRFVGFGNGYSGRKYPDSLY